MSTEKSPDIESILSSLPLTRAFVKGTGTEREMKNKKSELELARAKEHLDTAAQNSLFLAVSTGLVLPINDSYLLAQYHLIELFLLMGYEIKDPKIINLLWREKIREFVEQTETVELQLSNRVDLTPQRVGFYKGLLGSGALLGDKFKDPLEIFKRAFE